MNDLYQEIIVLHLLENILKMDLKVLHSITMIIN